MAGAGAVGTSAANVVGGLQDRSRLSKVTPVVAALPSSIVSEEERAAVFSRAADADRRIVLNAIGVAPAIAAGPKWLLYSGRAGKSYFGGLSVPKVAPKDGKQVFDAIGTFDDLPQIPANQLTSLRQFRAMDQPTTTFTITDSTVAKMFLLKHLTLMMLRNLTSTSF